jgi:hypothetical protein
LLDKFLFIFGRQIGMKVEVPQIAPPDTNTALPKVAGTP